MRSECLTPAFSRAPHVYCHVCHTHARPCLGTGWALNRRFDLTVGTAAVLVQGGGGGTRLELHRTQKALHFNGDVEKRFSCL